MLKVRQIAGLLHVTQRVLDIMLQDNTHGSSQRLYMAGWLADGVVTYASYMCHHYVIYWLQVTRQHLSICRRNAGSMQLAGSCWAAVASLIADATALQPEHVEAVCSKVLTVAWTFNKVPRQLDCSCFDTPTSTAKCTRSLQLSHKSASAPNRSCSCCPSSLNSSTTTD